MLDQIKAIYDGSSGKATSDLYARLADIGPMGIVAVNLMRACKASARAKVYRGGRFKGAAYDKKDWSIGQLIDTLVEHHDAIRWGWGIDDALKARDDPHHHVLYVELPTGQVSFHTATRRRGPEHDRPWDRARLIAADRICAFAAGALTGQPMEIVRPAQPVERPTPLYTSQSDLFR